MSDPAAQRIIDRIDFSRRGPTVLAYGVGVDSTAISVENRLAHIRAAVL